MSLIDRGQHNRIQPLQTIPAQPLAHLTRSIPVAAAVDEHRVFGVAQQNGLTAAAWQIRHRIVAVLVLHLGDTQAGQHHSETRQHGFPFDVLSGSQPHEQRREHDAERRQTEGVVRVQRAEAEVRDGIR